MLGLPTDVERIDGSPGSDTIYFNAARWTVVIILISHSWHIKHNNKRQPSQIVEKCSIRSKRVYGPRLYPYVATNWEFIWPGPGKRYSYFIIQVPAYVQSTNQDKEYQSFHLLPNCRESNRNGVIFQPVYIFSKSQPEWQFRKKINQTPVLKHNDFRSWHIFI